MGMEIRSVCCEAGQNRKLTSENRITEGKRVKLFHCTYFLVSGSLSTSIFLSEGDLEDQSDRERALYSI